VNTGVRLGHRLAAVPVVLGMLLLAVPAFAQSSAEAILRDARLAPDGETRLLVGVEGLEGTTLDDDAFRVLEDGQEIEGLEVDPLSEIEETPIVVALVFDISGSVRPVFEQIQAAAISFVRDVTEQGVEVALIPFSSVIEVAVPPTSDTATLEEGIMALAPGGATPLYDAVVTSTEVLGDALAGRDGIAQIVVFSDGGDTNSENTLGDTIAAAQEVEAPITSVAWETDDLDPEALAAMASATGGTVVASEDAGDIEGLFQSVAADITSQYVIRYSSDILEPTELPVSVIVSTPDNGELRVDSTAINARTAAAQAPTPPPPSELSGPRVALLGTTAGLWLGLLAAFLAVLALLWIILVSSRQTAGARSLERGLRAFGRGGQRSNDDLALPTSKITERAVDLVGRVPKPKGFDERLQAQLDRAAWMIRSNEFLVMCIAAGSLGALILGAITQNLLGVLPGALLGGLIPVLVMKVRISKRQAAFVDQLPGTLQLLAGSLRAGYGLLQALDAVVKEADEPTSQEFARVLTEVRLGMPLDESLEGMAQRLDSEDFHWVVLAIGIQREVGGNLAELLTTVAKTMRDRATLRRQIRVLSAEGRVSAWVVAVMPFFVAAALSLLNPGYLAELFTRIEGIVMVVMGLILLLLGGLWLRKIVDIEV
jgi:tight adherence protein B